MKEENQKLELNLKRYRNEEFGKVKTLGFSSMQGTMTLKSVDGNERQRHRECVTFTFSLQENSDKQKCSDVESNSSCRYNCVGKVKATSKLSKAVKQAK